MDIANIYLQSGKYDLALKEYSKVPIDIIFVPPTRVYYELAKVYAMKKDEQKAAYYLNKVANKNRDLAQFALIDNSFDLIRESKEMKDLLERLK